MANTQLPPFDENGLLPEEIYHPDDSEFEQRFVIGFPGSSTRQRIYEGFCRLRMEIAPLGLNGWHWVDGSYVTAKVDPEDLDLVTFADSAQVDNLSTEDQTTINDLINGEDRTKRFFGCDTFFVSVLSHGDPLYSTYERVREGWRKFFSRTNLKKTGMDLPKGFVELPVMEKLPETLLTIMADTITQPGGEKRGSGADIEWSAAYLEQHLTERLLLREEIEQSGDTRFSIGLQLQSMKREEEWLRRKLAAARLVESNFDVEVVVDGTPVVEHRIDASFFGKLLTLTQNVVEHLTSGNAPSRLQVAAFAPSSFKASFVLAADSQETPELELDTDSTSGADVLAQILDGSAGNVEIINALSDKQVKRDYARMVKLIGNSGATVYFRTRHNPMGARITSPEARDRFEWLNALTIKVEPISIVGELRGGSLTSGRFEIQTDNGSYSGRTKKESAAQIRGFRFGQAVRAVLERTTQTHIDFDVPLVSYALRSIEDATAPRLDI